MPETLPRLETGTWSGSVAVAAASTRVQCEACTMHQAMSTIQIDWSRRR